MDKKTAYKVLGLSSGASREDAKNNYRKLAKIYHPDLSSSDSDINKNDQRMKEINVAYRFLIPFLKVETNSKSSRKKSSIHNDKEHIKQTTARPQKSFLSKMIREVKYAFKAAARPDRKRKPNRETPKAPVSRTVKYNSNVHFDEILSKLHVQKEGLKTSIRKPRRTINSNDSSKAYRRYMELKRKMKATKTTQQTSVGRVERISPIDPVKPVNKS